jgi:tetratricopeptide (TPR) repeat protein
MTRNARITVALEHHKAGRLAEADSLYQAMLADDPADADALHLSGAVALAQGDPARSLDHVARALVLRQDPAYRLSLGAALAALGRHAEAAAAIEAAIAAGAGQPQAHESLAALYLLLQRWPAAEAASRRAIPGHPSPAQAWHNLGTALTRQDRLPEAVDAFTHALDLRPADPNAANDLALLLESLGRHPEALARIDQAAALAPGNPAIRYNRALMLLRAGRHAEGWPGLDARLDIYMTDRTYTRHDALPRWTGEPLAGQTLLLTHEQGLGDTIQFARYARLLAGTGAAILIDVQPPLRRLFATLPGPARLVQPGDTPTRHCPLMSLPALLGTTPETIPADIPYVHAEPGAATRWAARIRGTGPAPRVGIVWAGNPNHAHDHRRSIPFDCLAPLLQTPGITWFSLQTGPQATHAAHHPTLHDLSASLTDFAETAAAMAALDLVVTVDTATAHLAGALGRPTWLLLHEAADWRWFTAPDTTPWYPTLRLYRQTPTRTWSPVLARLATDLQALPSNGARMGCGALRTGP